MQVTVFRFTVQSNLGELMADIAILVDALVLTAVSTFKLYSLRQ